jgi:cytochrome c biogenesis protein CcmG, thiol:disulfide interchange protein DsbE
MTFDRKGIHMRATRILSLILIALILPALALAEGKKIPRLSITDLEGKKHDVKEFLGEGPVLLNFWATYCKPCLAELPKIEAFQKEWAEETGLKLITVSIDQPRMQKQVRPFVHRHGFKFPVYTDSNQEALRKLGGRGVPFNVLIGTDGSILDAHAGFKASDTETWAALILEDAAAHAVEESDE